MEKPDTETIRRWMATPAQLSFDRNEGASGYATLIVACTYLSGLADYIDSLPGDKAAIEQVRKFVRDPENFLRATTMGDVRQLVLDFIDNGPPKPTAEEVAQRAIEGNTVRGKRYADIAVEALREAGYLRDEG